MEDKDVTLTVIWTHMQHQHQIVLGELKNLGTGMDRLEGRMDGLMVRMDGLEGRMNRLERRMDNVIYQINAIDGRLDAIEIETLPDRVQKLEMTTSGKKAA